MTETTVKTCRICLEQIMKDASYHFLNNKNDLMLQTKLLDFLPELDLNITQNPISCSECTRMINEIHRFKQLCVRTENIIKNQSFQEAHIFKEEQLDESIKEEFIENPIKDEQTVKDECMEINNDIPVCNEEFTSTKELYYCYNCNYSTDKKKNLISHVSTHQNEISKKKSYQCTICKYNCINNESLKIHMHIHTRSILKTYKCNECEFASTNKTRVTLHTSFHKMMKVFTCDKCEYSTRCIDELREHMNHLHPQNKQKKPIKKYECSKCKFVTPWKSTLVNHIRTHTKEKSFCCNICDYRCGRMSTLKRHLCTHSKEKPYCCVKCDYWTTRITLFKIHLDMHAKEKSLDCKLCDYRTTDMSKLKEHLFTHTEKKPFYCTKCNYRTTIMSVFNSHLRMHTEEIITPSSILFLSCDKRTAC